MTGMTLEFFVPAFVALLLKATGVIALAWTVRIAASRWLSAAGRHLATLLAIAMLLALPGLVLLLPGWAPPSTALAAAAGLPGAAPAPAPTLGIGDDGVSILRAVASPGTAPAPEVRATRVSWGVLVLAVQLVGTAVMLVHLGAQRWRVHRIGRQAQVVDDRSWLALLDEAAATLGVRRRVRLLRSRRGTMPMTFGTRRPAILLPATADTWEQPRRRAVLLHELAHVARLDCLAQWAACAMRAVYWMHPGAWWLVSRLRLDREFACDDLVLAAGARPTEYARHLLDIAYTFGGGRAPALAVRMARRSQIERRLRALLDDSRVRRQPSRPARLASTIGAFAVLVPLASVAPPVYEGTGAHRSAVRLATVAPLARPVAVAVAQVRPAQPAQAPAATSNGCTWELGSGTGDTLHLSMRHGRSHSGRNVPVSSLDGLTAAQLAAGGAVRFTLRRDAGTFTFDGTARDRVAAGVCSFAPSPTFGADLATRGVTGMTAEQQLELARHDVGLALVDELRSQKYATPSVADLVKAGQHGVHLEYLRGMGALGYATGTLAPLITLRDHGVTPEYARALGGFGYTSLPIDQLQRARDHGVTADYLQGMRDGGFGSRPLDEMISTRDHGVTPDYVKEMKALGLSGPLPELVRARDHGITPDYVRRLADLGYKGLPIEQLLRLRDHGVTPDYVKEVQSLGYATLTAADLVTLRDHGITPDRIRKANARAGSQLSVAALRDAAAHGWR